MVMAQKTKEAEITAQDCCFYTNTCSYICMGKLFCGGFCSNIANGAVARSANLSFTQVTNKKLLEIKKILEPDITDEMPIDTNARPAELDRRDHQRTGMKDGSTNGCFHSIGPDLTRTRELPEQQQNVCMRSRQGVSARDKDSSRTPISMREVNEPILQQVKLQKAIAQ